jgi:hypothetical protein
VLVTFPQAKVLVLLALAALLAIAALTLVAVSSRPTASNRGAKSIVVVSSGRATPGSTAHARSLYRASLGR